MKLQSYYASYLRTLTLESMVACLDLGGSFAEPVRLIIKGNEICESKMR